jgi:hypothetical protein
MNKIAFLAKKTTPLFKNLTQFSKKSPCFSMRYSCNLDITSKDYLAYIENKKRYLIDNKLPFTERAISNNLQKYSILIHDSDSNKNYLNNKIQDKDFIGNTFIRNKNYRCENFSLAVAQGIHPREFFSIEAIKSQPALKSEHIDNYNKKIPKSAYYISFNNLLDALTDIATLISNKPYNNSQGYLLITTNHAYAIIVEKKDNRLILKFYDPDKATNCYKIFILNNANDINHLGIYDFMNLLDKYRYFSQNFGALLSIETVTTNKEACIQILGDITTTKIAGLLNYGHYKTGIIPKNNDILNPVIFNEIPGMPNLFFIKWILPNFSKKTPIFYCKIYGFVQACFKNHAESINDYIKDILSLPCNVQDKIKALNFPYTGSIYNSMLDNSSVAWEVFYTTVLKSKDISPEDKITLLSYKFKSPRSNLYMLSCKYIIEKYYKYRLQMFNKYLEDILNANTLTEYTKIKLITGDNINGKFWITYLFKNNNKLKFLESYLDKILNTQNISNKAKVSLLDFKLPMVEKELLLYDGDSISLSVNFALTYITKIITSTLSINDKQYLLDIKKFNLCEDTLKALEKNNPEVAQLCIDTIPAYSKMKDRLNWYHKVYTLGR